MLKNKKRKYLEKHCLLSFWKEMITIMGIIVSICGIYIASVANQISNDSNQMQQLQNDYSKLQNDYLIAQNTPHFVYTEELVEKGLYKTMIRNTQGRFIDVRYYRQTMYIAQSEETDKMVIVYLSDSYCGGRSVWKDICTDDLDTTKEYNIYNAEKDYENQIITDYDYTGHLIDFKEVTTLIDETQKEAKTNYTFNVNYIDYAVIEYVNTLGEETTLYNHVISRGNPEPRFVPFDDSNWLDQEIIKYINRHNEGGYEEENIYNIQIDIWPEKEHYLELLNGCQATLVEFWME